MLVWLGLTWTGADLALAVDQQPKAGAVNSQEKKVAPKPAKDAKGGDKQPAAISPSQALRKSPPAAASKEASSEATLASKPIEEATVAESLAKEARAQQQKRQETRQKEFQTIQGLYRSGAKDFAASLAYSHLKKYPESQDRYFLFSLLSYVDPSKKDYKELLQESLASWSSQSKTSAQRQDLLRACINFRLSSCIVQEYQALLVSGDLSKQELAPLYKDMSLVLFANEDFKSAQTLVALTKPYFNAEQDTTDAAYFQLIEARIAAETQAKPSLKVEQLAKQEKTPLGWRLDFLLALAKKQPTTERQKTFGLALSIAKTDKEKLKVRTAEAEIIFLEAMENKKLEKKQLLGAVQTFEEAKKDQPEAADAYSVKIAWLQQKAGNEEASKKELRKLKNTNQEQVAVDAALLLALQYREKKDYKSSSFILQNTLAKTKQEDQIVVLRYEKLKNYYLSRNCSFLFRETSLTPWEKYKAYKDDVAYWNGECYFEQRNFVKANTNYGLLKAEKHPALRNYFISLLAAKRLEDAKKLAAANPEEKESLAVAELRFYNQQKDYKRAALFYGETTKKEKLDSFVWNKEALVSFANLRDTKTLDTLYRRLIAQDRDNLLFYIDSWARFYQQQKSFQMAEKVYALGLQQASLDQKEQIRLWMAANAFDHLKKPNQAITDLVPLVSNAKSPFYSAAVQISGEAYIALQQNPKAIALLEKSLSQLKKDDPAKAKIMLRVAMLYHSQKDWTKALTAYREFLKAYPNDPNAKEAAQAEKQIDSYLKQLKPPAKAS